MLLNYNITAVDFDGTLCEDKWPEIGEPNEEVIQYIKDKKAAGNKIILWTCRIDQHLANAILWCLERGLIFDAINENVQEIYDVFPVCGRKIYYDELVDDKNVTKFKLPYNPEKKTYGISEIDEYMTNGGVANRNLNIYGARIIPHAARTTVVDCFEDMAEMLGIPPKEEPKNKFQVRLRNKIVDYYLRKMVKK